MTNLIKGENSKTIGTFFHFRDAGQMLCAPLYRSRKESLAEHHTVDGLQVLGVGWQGLC